MEMTSRSIVDEWQPKLFRWRAAALWCVVLVALAGCGPSSSSTKEDPDSSVTNPDSDIDVCEFNAGEVICEGNHMVTCNEEGEEAARQDCGDFYCLEGKGCVLCYQGDTFCQGSTVMGCSEDNMHWEEVETCDPNQGQVCDPEAGGCVDLCEQAAENRANVGCEYLAVDMSNIDESQAQEACFVVIVSNVQPEGVATVMVEDEQGNVLDFPGHGTERQIAPGELAVLALTGLAGQCSLDPARPNATNMQTGLQPGSVFVIKSTLPVVAYQINPYEAADKHTTDASLLIPRPALGTQYITANYFGLNRNGMQIPSSISVIAASDNTTVTINPSVAVQAGGPVPGGSDPFDVTLNAREHLQIVSQGHGDLTGSTVTAATPVAVFSGDLCTDIPVGVGYCDHLEEQMPPVNSWGWTYLAANPPQRRTENTLWRIIAAVDDTQLYFEPLSQYDQVVNKGDVVEVDTDRSFLVYAVSALPDSQEDPPILVVNYLKGAEQTASESGTSIDDLGTLRGDPAMTLSVPAEQYLNSYIFLSDATYAYNYVVVVRTDPNQTIHLDCLDPIPSSMFTPVSGDFARALITLSAEDNSADGTCQDVTDGVHQIWSDQPFGIWVYGYYADTSYGYPGGLNLEQINDVIIVD
jgi:hypothetical protein